MFRVATRLVGRLARTGALRCSQERAALPLTAAIKLRRLACRSLATSLQNAKQAIRSTHHARRRIRVTDAARANMHAKEQRAPLSLGGVERVLADTSACVSKYPGLRRDAERFKVASVRRATAEAAILSIQAAQRCTRSTAPLLEISRMLQTESWYTFDHAHVVAEVQELLDQACFRIYDRLRYPNIQPKPFGASDAHVIFMFLGSDRTWLASSLNLPRNLPPDVRALLKRWHNSASPAPFAVLRDIIQSYWALRCWSKIRTKRLASALCEQQQELAVALSSIGGIVAEAKKLIDLEQTEGGIRALIARTKRGDFSIVPFGTPRRLLQTTWDALQTIPGASAWLARSKSGLVTCPNGTAILQKLATYAAVDACGHSGFSMSWTLTQLRGVYRDGWNVWARAMLISSGIGWREATLDEAFECSEDCSEYLFFRLSAADQRLNARRYLDAAVRNGWTDAQARLAAAFKDLLT